MDNIDNMDNMDNNNMDSKPGAYLIKPDTVKPSAPPKEFMQPQYYDPSAPPLPQSDENTEEILNEILKQTEVNLCLLVAMLKEKKNTDKSNIISETIQKIENAPIPGNPGKIECNSDTIAPILLKIKKTMKVINKDLSDEQILDRIIGANISLIKKYMQLYGDISKKVDINMFSDISKILDNLLNSVSSLNVGQNQDQGQGQGQGQSIGSVEASELVIETFALALASSQMIAGKKFQRKTQNSRKSKKSKKKRSNKRHYKRKSKRQRKLKK
jgi:hypothetical protein